FTTTAPPAPHPPSLHDALPICTAITEELGLPLEKVTAEHFGTAKRVRITKDATTIVGGKGQKKAIDERVAQIEVQIKATKSDYEDRKSTRLNSSHVKISYAVFC